MNLQKLNPWNWLKDEENSTENNTVIPVKRNDYKNQASGIHSLAQFQRDINSLFDDAFKNFGFPSLSRNLSSSEFPKFGQLANFNPDINIASDDKEYTITLEAAGLEKKDIELELTDRRLSIKGNKEEESENKDKNFYRIERRYGSFQRVLTLPEDANAGDIKASMQNGLLTIQIPRKESEAENTRKIEINPS